MFNLFLFLCPGVDSGISKLELKTNISLQNVSLFKTTL